MIKNIILDIGGIILDISNAPLVEHLNKTEDEIRELNKIVYNKNFNQCLLGNKTQKEYAEELIKQQQKYKEEIQLLLLPKYQKEVLPLIKETLEYVYKLKEKGYKIYFLSNLTQETYKYLTEELHILQDFEGGIYSFKEKVLKPHDEIYNLFFERYNVNKKETIFFDDTEKNVIKANELGIKSVVYKSIEDIKRNI